MCMFRKHGRYRHINTLDVDLYVHKIGYVGPNYLKLRVSYVNRHNGIVYGMETVKILREQIKYWSEVSD